METQMKFCQSCGMPLNTDADHGTNADKSLNEDYCVYCFKEGNFTSDTTMDGMIETCLQFLDEFNKDAPKKLTKEEARAEMKKYFPMLKRWAK
ncbi:hypothetical protein M2132_001157 [Dysgonomonas sp. PH5-45]|uniref:zinc ribbon domain-containing protein n=1 Tax=unclassified Dysgonomonas TaxID=2630389 RepID=UPI002473E869|nr:MULTISPECIES: zinc ribbon domain-containing protein [unclassified Dysgonomonas]MDH6354826.1 hypothetical protein [Dysgonomonas sp. PH5-45]MDH6387725.1 hypothetical protein [Dysgonomonas sp. PH5-37]